MKEKDISELWRGFNETLAGLSTDNFDFLTHPTFCNITCMKHKFDWSNSGHPDVYPGLELPVCDLLEEKGVQRNTVMCLTQISHLLAHFPDLEQAKVLEMGGAFGNFCRVLHKVADVSSYTMLDTPVMLPFAQKYLEYHGIEAKYVDSPQKLVRNKFDLLIANLCLGQTPEEYREYIGEKIFPRCQRCFIIDGSTEESGFHNWLVKVLEDNFTSVEVLPIATPWVLCKLYIGKN